MQLSFAHKRAIGKYQPISIEDNIFYPVLVDNYEEFLMAKPALEFLQQSLPVAYMGLPLMQALWRMELETVIGGGEATGIFSRLLLALALSLRLGEGKAPEERIKVFSIVTDPQDGLKLTELRYVVDGEEIKRITPIQFARIRPILAAQNGIELLSDDANPELVEAEREIAEQGSVELKADIESMVTAAAALSGVEESAVYGWPILKLRNRLATYKRCMDYIICSINEGAGVSWKGGNPCPSPWFERIREGSSALIPLSEFAGGAGDRAVQNAGEKTY